MNDSIIQKTKSNGRTTWIVHRNEKKTIVFLNEGIKQFKIVPALLIVRDRFLNYSFTNDERAK